MKKGLSLILTLSLMLALCGCQQNVDHQAMQKEFTELIQEDFEETIENDYLTYHILLENPENYGIEKEDVDIDFGDVLDNEGYRDYREDILEIQEKFKRISRDALTISQQEEYDQMSFLLSYMLKLSDSQFDYYSSYFSAMSGIHTVFQSLLADFPFRNEQDIQDYIRLLKSYAPFVEDVLIYTKKQAEKGTMMIDIDNVVKSCEKTLKISSQSSILKSVNKSIEQLNLDQSLMQSYKQQIKDAYVNSYLVGIENIAKTLSSLKDKPNNQLGLSYLPHGKEYYELLFQNTLGSYRSIEDMKTLLNKEAKKALRKIIVMMKKDPEIYTKAEKSKTKYKNYESILEDLKQDIQKDFPAFLDVDYTIEALSQDIAIKGIAAYFNIPALDSSRPRQMFVNMNDGKKIDSIDTFTTVAHEGIPGHMYQIEYARQNPSQWLQLQSTHGFVEGYATYVELLSLDYLKDEIDKEIIDFIYYNTIYFQCITALCDIGIHYEGWDVEKTNQFLKASGLNENEKLYQQIQSNPLAFIPYYCGYIEIIELKKKAQNALGKKFDLKEFHEALLSSGNVAFPIIEKRIETYIQARKS